MNSSQFIQTLHTKPNKAIFYLYKKSKPIRNWIKANSGSSTEADDILQDGVTILYQNLIKNGATLTSAPESYLMGICKNLWFSELRKQKRIPISTFTDQTQLNEIPLEEYMDDGLPLNQLGILLNQLGTKCNELLNLFYFQRKSMHTIAQKLNFRNDKVAKAMKYKCLAKARKIITQN